MKQTIKQQKAGMEMLCQKAGIINRELDAKCEKLERIYADIQESDVSAHCSCEASAAWCAEAQAAARFAMWMASAALVFLVGIACLLFV